MKRGGSRSSSVSPPRWQSLGFSVPQLAPRSGFRARLSHKAPSPSDASPMQSAAAQQSSTARRADRAVSGRARRSDPRRRHLSRADRGSRAVDATTRRPQGTAARPGSGQANLGPERQSADGVSGGARQHGQEPLVDVVPRRRLRQSRAGRDEHHPGHARARAGGRQRRRPRRRR